MSNESNNRAPANDEAYDGPPWLQAVFKLFDVPALTVAREGLQAVSTIMEAGVSALAERDDLAALAQRIDALGGIGLLLNDLAVSAQSLLAIAVQAKGDEEGAADLH